MPVYRIDQSFPAYFLFEVQDPQAAFVGLLGMIATVDNLDNVFSHCGINTISPIDKAGSTPSGNELVGAGQMFCNGRVDIRLVIASVHGDPVVFIVDLHGGRGV